MPNESFDRRALLRAALVGAGAVVSGGVLIGAAGDTEALILPKIPKRFTTTVRPTTTTTVQPTTTTTTPPPSNLTLQQRLDALQSGQTLTLQSGATYVHDVPLIVRVPNVTIDGAGATITASNEGQSALKIQADGVLLKNVNVGVKSTSKRWDTLDQHKIVLNQTKGVRLEQVNVTGSAAAGVFVFNSSGFRLTGVTVSNTRADGIHVTNGSSDGVVAQCKTIQTGDDGFAVVSYGNEVACRNITFVSPVVQGQSWGRGVTVVGGESVSIQNPQVTGSAGAAIYIACEDSYNTTNVNNVTVSGAVISNANTNAQINHGAIMVCSSKAGGAVTNVTFTGVKISGTRAAALGQVSLLGYNGGVMSGVKMETVSIASSTPSPFVTNVARSSFTMTGWTVAGVAFTP